MKQVSKEEFFATIGPLNVHPRIVTDRYPYTSEWRFQDGGQKMIGKSVGKIEGGKEVTDYFLEGEKK